MSEISPVASNFAVFDRDLSEDYRNRFSGAKALAIDALSAQTLMVSMRAWPVHGKKERVRILRLLQNKSSHHFNRYTKLTSILIASWSTSMYLDLGISMAPNWLR